MESAKLSDMQTNAPDSVPDATSDDMPADDLPF
jgi:hypothetical protein